MTLTMKKMVMMIRNFTSYSTVFQFYRTGRSMASDHFIKYSIHWSGNFSPYSTVFQFYRTKHGQWSFYKNEPRHDKTNKMTVSPAKTQISLASAQSDQSLCWPWVLSYPLSAQRRLWSDWADLLVLSCRGSNTLSIEVLFGLGNCCIQWDSNAPWIPDSKSGGLTARSSRDNEFAESAQSIQSLRLR